MNRSKRFPTWPLFQRLAPHVAPLEGRERALLWLVAAFVLVACFGPALPDPSAAGGAGFADARAWHGLPFAMDVLSNLPFAAFGIWGLMRLRRFDTLHERLRSANALDCAWLFFAGLIFTAAGSVFYHLQPDALRLAADRAGMAIAFAGILGLAVCERVSLRAGWPAACVAFAGGLMAVAVYHERGDVLPWAVVQFGGMALVLGLALLRPVPGIVTSAYGYRRHPIYGYWGLHDGTDFGVSCGENMRAIAGGKVIAKFWSNVYGNRLYLSLGNINGKNVTAVYNHATSYRVSIGDRVSQGETVGYVGSTGWSTGCHLHFTILVNGTAVDPMQWLP